MLIAAPLVPRIYPVRCVSPARWRDPALCDCSAGPAGGGVVAKDALGNDVKASKWLASHKAGDHSLTQGLKAWTALL